VRRWCLAQLAQRRSGLLAEAVAAALASRLGALRYDAAHLLSALDPAVRGSLLAKVCAHAPGPLRAVALSSVPQAELERPLLEACLLDPHFAVRRLARRELARRDRGFSAAAHYRRALLEAFAKTRATALQGLGECGVADDAAEAVVLLSDRSANVRVAALRCLRALAPADAVEAAVEMLSDPSNKVLSAAAGLAWNAPAQARQAAAERLLRCPSESARRVGHQLLTRASLSQRLSTLAALFADPGLQMEAFAALSRTLSPKLATTSGVPAPLAAKLREGLASLPLVASSPDDKQQVYASRRSVAMERARLDFILRTSTEP
jgi:hypothetical protein